MMNVKYNVCWVFILYSIVFVIGYVVHTYNSIPVCFFRTGVGETIKGGSIVTGVVVE